MNKILALNSGGFDSVVMLHYLKEEYPNVQIDTLFMNWKQPMLSEELRCAKNVAEKLGMGIRAINVDDVGIWDCSDMEKEPYIPMRNFVFIVNAIAHAQKFGYDTIALAIINNGSRVPYFDCTEGFINGLNNVLESQGIEIITPFIRKTKSMLSTYAKHYKITKEDFFTCNTPIYVNGKLEPCNNCTDCEMINLIYDRYIDNLYIADPHTTPNYEERYINHPIYEMRLLINNKCQFNCSHCFYGFDETLEEDMSIDEFKDIINQAKEMGIYHVHISGKEPLYDDSIFELTEYMDELGMTYDIVTNGVNIEKYIDKLDDCMGLYKVFLSVDSITDTHLRNTGKHILSNIKLMKEHAINIQITIDLCKDNLSLFDTTLHQLSNVGITEVYVRPIALLGNAETNNLERISCEDLAEIFDNALLGKYPIDITVGMNKYYYWKATEDDIKPYLDLLEDYGCEGLSSNLKVSFEKYCTSFMNQITVTSDGYLLGCGSQISCKEYDKISPGNVKRDKLLDLLYKGKKNQVKYYQNLNKNYCFFTK